MMTTTKDQRKLIKSLTEDLIETQQEIQMIHQMSGFLDPKSDYLVNLEAHENMILNKIAEIKQLNRPSLN